MHTKNKTVTDSGNALSVYDAITAVEYAQTVVNGCESIDDLDAASDFDTAMVDCPEGFTWEQRHLAQQVILRAFEKSIGRA